jgi:hypothetical protein
MEGFNDVWANILNDDLLNKRDILTPLPHTASSPGSHRRSSDPFTRPHPPASATKPPSTDPNNESAVLSQHSITLTLPPHNNKQKDLFRSPPRGKFSRLYQSRGGVFKVGMEVDRLSEISRVTSVMSQVTIVAEEEEKQAGRKVAAARRYEMVASVKQPSKRVQPAQKH